MEALQFGQAYNSKHHVVSPWLRVWVLEYVIALPLNINSYHICRWCHVLSLVATEATFLWSLLFMSVSCSLCCMGFSSLFCLKSRCAWLVLKFSLHQLFTCKHSLTLCLLFVPCVCSECALLWISCWSLVFVSALQVVLSLTSPFSLACQTSSSFLIPFLSFIPGHYLMFNPHIPTLSHTQPFFDVQTSQTFFFSYPTPFHTINDHWLVDGWPRTTKCLNQELALAHK